MNIAIDPKVPGLFDDMIDAVLTDPEGPRIDLKKDLFYRCLPTIITASRTSISHSDEAIRESLWILSLEEGVDAKKIARELFEGDDVVFQDKLEEFDFWFTKDGEPLLISAETESMNPIQALACDSKYVVVCTNVDWLKSILNQGPAESKQWVSQHPMWALRLEAELGQPNSILHAADLGKSFRVDWESIRRVDDRSLLGSVVVEAILGGTSYASTNKSLIPDWQSVQSAFGLLTHQGSKQRNQLHGTIHLDGQKGK